MKKWMAYILLGLIAFLSLEGCSSKNSIRIRSNFWTQKGRYIQVPFPEPVELTLPIEEYEKWSFNVDVFTKDVFPVNLVLVSDQDVPVMQFGIRGCSIDLLKQDSSFNSPIMQGDSAFVMYFLDWDKENSFTHFEPLKNGSVVSKTWYAKDGFGVLCVKGDDAYQKCSAAKLTSNNNLYVLMASNSNPLNNPGVYVMNAMESFKSYRP